MTRPAILSCIYYTHKTRIGMGALHINAEERNDGCGMERMIRLSRFQFGMGLRDLGMT